MDLLQETRKRIRDPPVRPQDRLEMADLTGLLHKLLLILLFPKLSLNTLFIKEYTVYSKQRFNWSSHCFLFCYTTI
ncbi:hypothetical protein XELAEV_18038102mg [Xenopus laevis]|uniref:Uncharacterized protein n=1 Tax=Xenopus laevis TaxID=8355 RepID=A0A974C5E0_XENLA|nr:hypothetical protein XELAEV_18038102mg [Xenopus laevis]